MGLLICHMFWLFTDTSYDHVQQQLKANVTVTLASCFINFTGILPHP